MKNTLCFLVVLALFGLILAKAIDDSEVKADVETGHKHIKHAKDEANDEVKDSDVEEDADTADEDAKDEADKASGEAKKATEDNLEKAKKGKDGDDDKEADKEHQKQHTKDHKSHNMNPMEMIPSSLMALPETVVKDGMNMVGGMLSGFMDGLENMMNDKDN